MSQPKFLIIGMGPCGLGAAWRLQELEQTNFKIYEHMTFPGGLASSFTDENGFTWDNGGHVQFSHYKYFDDLMDSLLGDDWLYHDRNANIWMKDRFVPYPFQNNIRYLPKEDMWRCLSGLIDLYKNPAGMPGNFHDWILAVFGKGIADLFMFPYNFKVWAYPAEKLSYQWIGERVAVTDLKRVTENILFERDDVSWGPNNKFRFPLRGGTGEIWRRLFQRLDKHKTFFEHELMEVNTRKRFVRFKNGVEENYDFLISTIPLDRLILLSDLEEKSVAQDLICSAINIVGVGLKGTAPEHLKTKTWMYFPEENCPFFRVTVFSNYSPNNVPDANRYWSLMSETSESGDKPVKHDDLVEQTIQGMLNTKLIRSREDIVDLWYTRHSYGYPTPSLRRDHALTALEELDRRNVFSRGRFGAWKYEVSNQDHSLMQGVEAVNKILLNQEEITVWNPHKANSGKN